MKISHLDRRSKYSQKMIRSALFELLEQKELKKITVTDICNLADVNRGTFYKYYQDVPDLFSKIVDSICEEISDILETNCQNHFSFDEIYSNVLSMLVENPDFNRFIMTDTMSCYTLIHKIIEAYRPKLLHSMMKYIPNVTPTDANNIFDFILGGTSHLIMQWLQDGMKMTQDEMKETLIKLTNIMLQSSSLS